jgi:hypothetical protein
MTVGHRSTHRAHFFVLPGGLPGTRIVLGTEGGLSSIGGAGIDHPAVRALVLRLGRGLTGEAA